MFLLNQEKEPGNSIFGNKIFYTEQGKVPYMFNQILKSYLSDTINQ